MAVRTCLDQATHGASRARGPRYNGRPHVPRPGHPRSEPGSRPPLQWPSLELPITPPYPPMEAKLVEAIPGGQGWLFEPKWDGFRCLAFRDGETVVLQSKAGQPLTRYFPEVAAAVRKLAPHRFVLDGEIAVPVDGEFAFDALLQRIHPSDSRVRKLAAETPAIFLVFDLLVDPDGRALVNESLADRRAKPQGFAARQLTQDGGGRLLPGTAAHRGRAAAGGDMCGAG